MCRTTRAVWEGCKTGGPGYREGTCFGPMELTAKQGGPCGAVCRV